MDKLLNELIKKSLKKVKDEPKEATGAGSAGGFEGPAFSMFSNDEEAKEEYKRMEGEFKESTSSSSVGAYDAPGFEDVNMRGNHPIGSGRSYKRTQIPGGSFVSFNKKCKTFPYCSQGDSKDKPVREVKPRKIKKSPLSEAIENVSLRTGLSEEEIKKIILKSIK
jgi:ribosomal protein L34E